jgi:hypothetical protein
MEWLNTNYQNGYSVVTRHNNIIASDINYCNFFEYHHADNVPQFVNFFTGEIVTIDIVINDARELGPGEYSPYLTLKEWKKIDDIAKFEAELLRNQFNPSILSQHSVNRG